MDRIAVMETLAVLAHDFGLYGVLDRLENELRFRGRPTLRYTRLDLYQQDLYWRLSPRAEKTGAWDRKLQRL